MKKDMNMVNLENLVNEVSKNMEEIKMKNNKSNNITSYEVNKVINEYRESQGIKSPQLYHNFINIIKKNEEAFFELGAKYMKKRIDNHKRGIYILNADCINLLMSTIYKDSDLVPLQKIYKELGGSSKEIIIVNRPEDEFMMSLNEVLNELGIEICREYNIGKFRVDAIIKSSNLVIEYDDSYHNNPSQISKDNKRQEALEGVGYDVVRLNYKDSNSKNIGKVLNKIMEGK